MRRSRLITLSLLLLALCGCQSGKFIDYTSPEVTGRVLAADTRQPLANVWVQRVANNIFEPFGPPKGGQLLIQPGGVRTDADGRFVLASTSVFTVFRQPGWWSVAVNYSRSGYEAFQTNYTAGNFTTNTPAGAPVVDTGDVLLQPLAR